MPDMEMRFRPGGAIKALTGRRLEVLACPYGGPEDLDKLGEYFTARTEFMVEVGDRRPTLYFHGFAPNKQMTARPAPIGVATATRSDNQGLWMEVELKPTALADRVWAAAEAGKCRASTGAVNYLCRTAKSGEVEVWPIGELSLLDEGLGRHPVNDKAVAIPLRASFEAIDLEFPEAFGEDATELPVSDPPIRVTGGTTMATEIEVAVRAALEAEKAATAAKEAEKAALKASIIDELKGDPKHRALFSVQKESTVGALTPDEAKRGLTIEDKKENHEFIWRLRHPLTLPAEMRVHGADDYAMRGMEETEATEGLPLVPQDMLNRIWEIRDASSLVRRAGATIYQTNRLIFNIPREVTPMIALAAIAEEGAYIEDTPNLSLVPVTVEKHGCFVDASEELLEDQDLFNTWFTRACGRAWALAENIDLAALLVSQAGTAIGTAHTLTDDEILAWYYRLPQEYRDGASWFMNDGTLAFIRSMLILTPRAYGDFGFKNRLGEGAETLMGKPVYTNANFGDLTVIHAVQFAAFCNLNEHVAWVERRGMSIKVDPYTKMVNGITSYFPSARWCAAIIQATASQTMLGIV